MNRPFVLAATLVAMLSGLALGQGTARTVKVEKTPFRVEIKATGQLAPATASVVAPRPRGWRGRYVVEHAVEPGTMVAKGDLVLTLNDRALREAIDDARFEQELAEQELETLRERAKIRANATAKDLARAERDLLGAERRLRDWLGFEKPRDAERGVMDRKLQDQSVKNAEEELRQLEKMYEEDELVDDTEAIVLERARWNLDRRKKLREFWIESRKRTLEIVHPRREEQLRFDLDIRQSYLSRARREAAIAAEGRVMSEVRAIRALNQRRRNLSRLEHALESMTVTAPAAGVLLHGPLEGALGRAFKKGDQVNPEQALISVVNSSKVIAVLKVPAKEALRLEPGAPVSLKPDVVGATEIPASIESVSPLATGGNFTVRCSIPAEVHRKLLGAKVSGTIALEETKEALSLPGNAVFRSGDRAFCLTAEGLTPVKVGREAGGRVEILGGLAEGAEVLPAPEEKK